MGGWILGVGCIELGIDVGGNAGSMCGEGKLRNLTWMDGCIDHDTPHTSLHDSKNFVKFMRSLESVQ